MARRWSINGRFLSQKMTGVQRCAYEVLLALDSLIDQGHPLAADLAVDVLTPEGATDVPALRSIRARRVGRFGGHAWEQLVFPLHAQARVLNLCNTAPLIRRRQVVCIHDTNTMTVPGSYSWQFRTLYRFLLPAVAFRAATVTTVSAFSAECLSQHGIAPARKISVVPNGHEHTRRWAPKATASTEHVGADTVVAIGSPAPHKNLGLLLDMAPELQARGLRLAIVGSLDQSVHGRTSMAASGGNVLWLGRLSDDELADILGRCLCLAFPSFTEGFGLPPLEAMALGCPVVTSDRASMPEVCGDAALYASPDDPGAWLDAFQALRDHESLRSRMKEEGREQALRFSWNGAAQAYLEVMARVDARSTEATRGRVSAGAVVGLQ